MMREWCPTCQKIQNMNMVSFDKIEKDENSKEVKVTIKNYQCSICHLFVRDEETKDHITSRNS